MQSDIKDWNEKLTEKEKHLVGNILLGFAQTECAVSDYWTQKVVGLVSKARDTTNGYDVWITRDNTCSSI